MSGDNHIYDFVRPGMYYRLDGREVTPINNLDELNQYLRDLESRDHDQRRVALTEVGEYHVSTVFLWLNHNHMDGPPILFESMAFGNEESVLDLKEEGFIERYCTYDEAEVGHERMVALLREKYPPPELELRMEPPPSARRLGRRKLDIDQGD